MAGFPLQDAGQARPSYSGEVHLATVAVTVTGRDRVPIDDLAIDDFEVLEDGRLQNAAFLLSPADTRLEVAVLLDTSSSIGRHVPDIRKLLIGFVSSLDPADCVLMLPFSDTVGPGFWNVDIERFALDFTLRGVTRLNDAIVAGLRALVGDADELTPLLGSPHCGRAAADVSNRRRVLVLITDGDDTASFASFGEALVTAWEARVPVIIMAVGNPDELTELANVTGGRFIEAGDRRRQSQSFRDILATLRSVYVIGYYLSNRPESVVPAKRSLEVRVRRDNAAAASPDAIYVSASRPGEAADLTDEGRAFFEAGDTARALDSFERATAAYWEVPSAHFLRAVVANRMGRLDLAESSARWAVFFDPSDPAMRALLQEIVARKTGSPATSPERGPSVSVWVEPADHASLPLQYVGAQVARIVAGYAGDASGIRIVRRPYDHGIAYGLSVSIREIAEDGTIRGELVLSSKQMERLDSKAFELMALEAQLSARSMPPQATEGLRRTIDPLLERMQRPPGRASQAWR